MYNSEDLDKILEEMSHQIDAVRYSREYLGDFIAPEPVRINMRDAASEAWKEFKEERHRLQQEHNTKWLNKVVYVKGKLNEGSWRVSRVEMDIAPVDFRDPNNTKFTLKPIAYLYAARPPVIGAYKEIRAELSDLIISEEVSELIEELWGE